MLSLALWVHKTSDSVLGHGLSTQKFWQCSGSRFQYTQRLTVCWVMVWVNKISDWVTVWVHQTSVWVTVWVHKSSERMLDHVLRTLHARHYCVTDKTLTEDRRCNILFTELSKTPTLCAPSPHFTCPYFRTVIPSMWVADSQGSRAVPTRPQISVLHAGCRRYTAIWQKCLLLW